MKHAILIFILVVSSFSVHSAEVQIGAPCKALKEEISAFLALSSNSRTTLYVTGAEGINERNDYHVNVTSSSYRSLTAIEYKAFLESYSSMVPNCGDSYSVSP